MYNTLVKCVKVYMAINLKLKIKNSRKHRSKTEKKFLFLLKRSILLFQTGADYTCVAVDKRDPKLRSSVTVQVHLANSESETCKRTHKDEIVWPETYKVSCFSLLL